MDNSEYLSKVDKEKEIFNEKEVVHDLPDSFHYWSNKYLKPRLENLGISGIPALFADPIAKQYKQKGHIVTVASYGLCLKKKRNGIIGNNGLIFESIKGNL